MVRKNIPPVRHIVLPEKREVWFVGSSTLAMGLKSIMKKYFPEGYKGCLASAEHFEELKKLHGSN